MIVQEKSEAESVQDIIHRVKIYTRSSASGVLEYDLELSYFGMEFIYRRYKVLLDKLTRVKIKDWPEHNR